jgi:hypothetical protein
MKNSIPDAWESADRRKLRPKRFPDEDFSSFSIRLMT